MELVATNPSTDETKSPSPQKKKALAKRQSLKNANKTPGKANIGKKTPQIKGGNSAVGTPQNLVQTPKGGNKSAKKKNKRKSNTPKVNGVEAKASPQKTEQQTPGSNKKKNRKRKSKSTGNDSNSPGKKQKLEKVEVKDEVESEDSGNEDLNESKILTTSPNKKAKIVKVKNENGPTVPIKKESESDDSDGDEDLDDSVELKLPKKEEAEESEEEEEDDDDDNEEESGSETESKKRKLDILDEASSEADSDDNEEPKAKKRKAGPIKPSAEEKGRTIFVGNVPVNATKKSIQQFFGKYGKVESVRIRGVAITDLKVPKKVAIRKKQLHPDRNTFIAYVKFAETESAEKSVEANGQLFEGHHLRVSVLSAKPDIDERKAIFIGNIPFSAEDDDLWALFEKCGPIHSVRIVRDKRTGIGKGFAYVNFQSIDGVELAMNMENVKLKERKLRISLCNRKEASKNRQEKMVKRIKKAGKPKKFKPKGNKTEGEASSETGQKKQLKPFQGTKVNDSNDNKKKKFNKGQLQKKKMAKKVAPKSDES